LGKSALYNFADNLVARDDMVAERFHLAFDDMQIRAAHAAGAHAKKNLIGPRLGNRDIANFKRSRRDACGTG
jgi:hypothetical protein